MSPTTAKKPIRRRIRQALGRVKATILGVLGRIKWKVRSRKVSAASIERDLKNGGIRKGELLVVHAALSRVGDVEGGASALCNALENAVGVEGTIVMPTYFQPRPILELLADMVRVDLRTAPSSTGKLSETFRTRAGVTRSSHPFSSCSAWGALGSRVTTGHDTTAFLCGRGSALANAWELGGKILGIGVDLGPISFYHVIEDTWDEFPVRTRIPTPFKCTYIDAAGQEIERDIFVLDTVVSRTRIESNAPLRSWLTDHFRKAGILREFPIGQAACWTMDTRALYDELKALAKKGITIYSTEQALPGRTG